MKFTFFWYIKVWLSSNDNLFPFQIVDDDITFNSLMESSRRIKELELRSHLLYPLNSFSEKRIKRLIALLERVGKYIKFFRIHKFALTSNLMSSFLKLLPNLETYEISHVSITPKLAEVTECRIEFWKKLKKLLIHYCDISVQQMLNNLPSDSLKDVFFTCGSNHFNLDSWLDPIIYIQSNKS